MADAQRAERVEVERLGPAAGRGGVDVLGEGACLAQRELPGGRAGLLGAGVDDRRAALRLLERQHLWAPSWEDSSGRM